MFIREFDPLLYQEYQVERVTAGFWKPNRWRIANPAVEPQPPKAEALKTAASPASGDPLSPLSRVDTLKEDHPARVFCEKRKIPDPSRLYHCPRFYAWSNWVLKTEKFSDKALYFDHPRLIIPFIADDRLVCFQGRDYRADSDAKYITIRVDEDFPKVYGLDQLDDTRTVYAVEGPIDSMFLPNCVSFVGGDHAILNELGFSRKNTVIVYDNEPRHKHTRKKVQRAIDDGYRVCIWPNYVVQKDPNDMVLDGLDPLKIIQSHTYQGLQAQLELSAWRG